MRILIINFEYPPLGGGGGVATSQMAAKLAQRHDVHVLTTWFSGLARYEYRKHVTVHRVPVLGRASLATASLLSLATFVPAALMAGVRLCITRKFDVINAQFVLPSGIPGALLARLFSIPLVISFIGGDVYDPSKGVSPHRYAPLRWVVRILAQQASYCTAISEDTKRRVQELHGVTVPIEVTHLGIEPMRVTSTSRRGFGLPQDSALFVSIGRLIPRKCYEALITAWRTVPLVHLAIVGAGPLREQLMRSAEAVQCADRVHLLGFIDEIRKQQLLQVADGYVSAAEHEGFGLVFLEAMEAGLPIVAVNKGGHTDFLVHEKNALLVEPHHPEQIARAVKRLLADTLLREQMIRENKEKVKEFYLEKTVARFELALLKAVQPLKL